MLDLVRNIDRRFFRPVVLCNAPLVADAARACGITAQLMDWPDAGARLIPSSSEVQAARRILEEHDIALVHCNSIAPIKALLPGVRARRIPLLAHLHLIHSLHARRYQGLHQVSLAVGVSEAALAGLRDDGMSQDRLRVIYNGVDPLRLEAGDASVLRDELGLSPTERVLVSIGSLIPRKGIDVLIDAMAILQQTNPGVHLLIVGDGPCRAELEDQSARLGLARTVHFLGERADVGAILRDAGDIAVSAAREEAFPLNVLEAAYCGLPIIASNISPHEESIADGETGVLVDRDSPVAFARAVQCMLSSPQRGHDLGARGAARVRESYLLRDYVAAFERTYLELLGRPSVTYGWFAASTWPRSYWSWLGTVAARRVSRVARLAARSAESAE